MDGQGVVLMGKAAESFVHLKLIEFLTNTGFALLLLVILIVGGYIFYTKVIKEDL